MKLCKIQYIAQKNDISNCVFLCYHDKKWISGSSRKPCACRWNGVRSPASRSLWCLLGQNKSGLLRSALCLAMTGAEIFSTYLGCIWKLPTHPDSGPFCGAPRHFSLKYVSIPAKKCLAQRKNPSLPVTSWVFRYTLVKHFNRLTRYAIVYLGDE